MKYTQIFDAAMQHVRIQVGKSFLPTFLFSGDKDNVMEEILQQSGDL